MTYFLSWLLMLAGAFTASLVIGLIDNRLGVDPHLNTILCFCNGLCWGWNRGILEAWMVRRWEAS